MINNDFKKTDIPDICGKINLNGINSEYFKSIQQSVAQGYKDLSADIYDELKNKEYQEEVNKNKEVLGIGKDVIVDAFKKGYNADVIQQFSDLYSNDVKNNKDDYNLETKIESFFKSGTSEFESCKKIFGENYNGIQLKEKLGLTDAEYDRILGQGEYKGFDMFDYSGESNFLNDFDIDYNIIKKCYESDILDENGKQLFADFQIVDENLNKLQFKNLNLETYKTLTNIFYDPKNKAKDFLNTFKAKKEFLEKIARLNSIKENQFKLVKGDNLKKVTYRTTGLGKLSDEYKEYASPLKPAKAAIKVKNVGIAGVKLGFRGYRELSLLREKREFRKALKTLKFLTKAGVGKEDLDIAKELVAMAKKDLDDKIKLFKLKEKKLNKVLHPYKSLRDFAFDKISNISIIRNNPISKLRKGISEGIGNITTKFIFRPLGLILRRPTDLVLSILKFVAPIAAIFGIVTIICLLVGLMSASVLTSASSAIIMPLATKDDFKSYQKLYDSLDMQFVKTLEDRFNGYARKTNLKGEKIYYGVNGLNNEEGMKNSDYKNGIHYHIDTDEEHQGITSNIEDIVAIMVVMMGQEQSKNREVALGTLEWLYNISHYFQSQDTPLYACDSGCHQFTYKCPDLYHYYLDTDMSCYPFHALKMSGGDYEIYTPTNHCTVCEQQFKGSKENPSCHIYGNSEATEEDFYGCVSHSSCYHGDEGNMGRSHSGCDDYQPVYECTHECNDENCSHDCSDNPIGCGGYWECQGHKHYSCDGHNYKCCMGHTDIRCVITIKFAKWIMGYINRYDFGEGDRVAKKLKKDPRNIYALDFNYYKSTE